MFCVLCCGGMLTSLRLCRWRGVWEALQLQRCVVLIVLDDAGVIWVSLLVAGRP
jgi:hypothetical protein